MRKLLALHQPTDRLTPRHWFALLSIPVLLLGLLVVAFRDPVDHMEQVKAAVVNEDVPVTVNGQLTPLGRELAADLVNDDDPDYDWVLTNSEDAADGLSSGEYKLVVTIPSDFSEYATSIGSTEPLDATEANIQIQSAADVPLADAAVGRVLADASRRSLGTTVTESYLGNLYDAMNTLHDQLAEAADGAGQLSDGATTLADGTGQLVSGSGELSDGADQLADGADQLADSTGELRAGAATLSSGLDQLETSTQDLPSQTQQLADGAAQVADGTQQVSDTVVPATTTIIQVIDDSPDAHELATELAAAAAACSGTPEFCASLNDLAAKASSDATQIESAKATARTKAQQAQDDVTALNTGAHQVADGNAALAQASTQLVAGISQAADGGQQLADGTAQLDDGADQLADGALELKNGADQLQTGIVQADDGAKQLSSGAAELASGLSDGLAQIPTFSEEERDHLKSIVAAPIGSDVIGTDGYTWSAMALFTIIALWTAALVAFAMLPAMPDDVRISSRPTWWLALKGSLPGLGVGAAQALAAALILAVTLELPPLRFLLVLVAGLATVALFMVVNRALAAAFGLWGRVVSIAVIALMIATAVTSAQPAWLQSLAAFLPTDAALSTFRNAVAGQVTETFVSMVPLVFWTFVAFAATAYLTERARVVPVREFRTEPGEPVLRFHPRSA